MKRGLGADRAWQSNQNTLYSELTQATSGVVLTALLRAASVVELDDTRLDTASRTRLPRLRGEIGFSPLTMARVMEFQAHEGLKQA